MTDGLTIRRAETGDAETIHAALLAMAKAIGDEGKITSTVDDIRKHGFGDTPAFEVLLAEIDGTFAGFCLTFPSFSTWRGELGIYVQDLYVEKASGGRGIGERLLREVARRGRDRGARYIRLSVDTANSKAIAFYQRLGITHAEDEQVQMIKGDAFAAFADGALDQT
jgi:ribosomal protein S18 acetylase RimI-like enzyme